MLQQGKVEALADDAIRSKLFLNNDFKRKAENTINNLDKVLEIDK